MRKWKYCCAILATSLAIFSCAGKGAKSQNFETVSSVSVFERCFDEAAKLRDSELKLEVPKAAIWDMDSKDSTALEIRVTNATQTPGILNRRGWTGPLGELVLVFTRPDGSTWTNRSNVKVMLEPDFPSREDYVRVAAGESVNVAMRLDSLESPMPAGDYIGHICYWDQYEGASQFGGGLRVLRGPAVAPLLRLTVKGRSR